MFISKSARFHRVVSAMLLACVCAGAQTHFTFTATTGNNMTMLVQTAIHPTLNGQPLAAGDEIGVFTPAGLCVGARVWDGVNNRSITVWGDNDQTPAVDGARGSEALSFRIWNVSGSQEVLATVTYDTLPPATSRGTYSVNGIAILASLTAPSLPLPPVLFFPADGATGLSVPITLAWNASAGAATYLLQVAEDSLFSSIVFSDSTLTSISKAVSLAAGTTCYWRVRAKNTSGSGSWSTVRVFTTEPSVRTAAFVPATLANAREPVTTYSLSGRIVSRGGSPDNRAVSKGCFIYKTGNRISKAPAAGGR